MRRLLNIFLLLVLLILLLFTGLFFMVELREDKIIALFRSQVEQNLRTQIELGRIDVSLIRQFPKASIELEDVVILSVKDFDQAHFGHNYPDTLCALKKVYLEFSLPALIAGRYSINSISLREGYANILTDKNGENNYTIWRPRVDNGTSKKPMEFNIQNIAYHNIRFYYINMARQIETDLTFEKGRLKIDRDTATLNLDVKTQLTSHYFKRGPQKWLNEMPLRLQGNFLKSRHASTFNDLTLTFLNRNKIMIDGSLGTGDQKTIDLRFSTASTSADHLMRAMPLPMNNSQWQLSDGQIQANGTVKGELGEQANPRVDILFVIEKARITDKKHSQDWQLTKAEGTFSNGVDRRKETAYLGIDRAELILGKHNRIILEGSLQNFTKQVLSLQTNFEAGYELINTYLPQTDYTLQAGHIKGQFDYLGTLSEYDSVQVQTIVGGIREGHLLFRELDIKGRKGNIKGAGSIQMAQDWRIDSAFITAGSNTIHFGGIISEPLALFNDQPGLKANVSAHINTFDLEEFIAFAMSEKSKKPSSNKSLQYHVNARASIGELVYNKVRANRVNVSSTLQNNNIRFHAFESDICDGKLSSSGALVQQSNGSYYLKCQSQLTSIDIHQLFNQFNNFKQDFLIAANIHGTISGQVDYYSEFDTAFAFQTSSMTVNSDVSIKDGELVQFEPLFALSRHIDVEELKHVKFANMENNILIKDRTVFIPQMVINSSALDLVVSGKHYFDNTFDYNVQVKLAEMLAYKFTNRKKNFEDVGYIVEEQGKELNIPLRISGNPENYQVKFNRSRARTSIRQSVQEEKEELKNLFRKKTRNDAATENQHENNVKVRWEDEREPAEKENNREKSKKSFQIEWDD